MHNLPEVFYSCDWGTSNFRLRLVRTENLEVLAEHVSAQGVAPLNRELATLAGASRTEYFSSFLSRKIEELNAGFDPAPPLAVVSGMASSSIGMKELPYAALPFGDSGQGLVTDRIALSRGVDAILVSGVCSDDDVMRGEETQALGLAAYLEMDNPGVLILPGTHSKHIRFRAGKFTGFRTFMTGELFQVLGRHSVLAASIEETATAEATRDGFLEGVQQGIDGQLAPQLFTIRSADLLGSRSKEENARFLSGLLIGSELAPLREENVPLWIAASPPLDRLYRSAIEHTLPAAQVNFIDGQVLERALLAGQREILRSASSS